MASESKHFLPFLTDKFFPKCVDGACCGCCPWVSHLPCKIQCMCVLTRYFCCWIECHWCLAKILVLLYYRIGFNRPDYINNKLSATVFHLVSFRKYGELNIFTECLQCSNFVFSVLECDNNERPLLLLLRSCLN